MRVREYLKMPVYWYDRFLKDMTDEEAGQMADIIWKYAFRGIGPDLWELTNRQKEAWAVCKKDIDYQIEHPHSYRYPEDENIAVRRSGDYNKWRTAVFERDQYTCQNCGQRGGILNAHHIKKFSTHPEERLSLDNGITLCKDCHRGIHKGEIILDLER